VREGRFSGPAHSRLASGTVRDTLDQVSSTFRAHDRPCPTLDVDKRPSILLQRQFRGYSNQDPAPRPEKAINGDVILELVRNGTTELSRAVGQLATAAFFFACRSCEYLSVSGQRRTKLLCLRNIRFYMNKRELPHSDPDLANADRVSVTFEFQKNDEREDTVM